MTGFFKNLPDLETPRLVMRKLTIDDIDAVFSYSSSPEVFCYTAFSSHQTRKESESFIRYNLNCYQNNQPGTWALVLKTQNRMIGTFGYITVDTQAAIGELGFVLAKPFWGQGLTSEAGLKAIEYGFKVMNLERIESFCDPRNEAGCKVMLKMGLTWEGCLRHKLYFNRQHMDLNCYSILKAEYLPMKSKKPL